MPPGRQPPGSLKPQIIRPRIGNKNAALVCKNGRKDQSGAARVERSLKQRDAFGCIRKHCGLNAAPACHEVRPRRKRAPNGGEPAPELGGESERRGTTPVNRPKIAASRRSVSCHREIGTCVAGAQGFEPGITGPKPVALPLGHAPSSAAAAASSYSLARDAANASFRRVGGGWRASCRASPRPCRPRGQAL